MTRKLVNHDDIRQWTAARAGNPAMADGPVGADPVLRLVFGQQQLNAGENQYGDRPGGIDLVSWEEWFEVFEKEKLALLVEDEKPGVLDDYHEYVERD
ncbi:hypothetical protein [Devosia sp.]|uniref:hypothetical protein n=1 Tax=Devosia sp. TaxID=1871048 RepID=UPI003A9091B9